MKRRRLAIAERDGSGLVEQQRVHVAGGLDGATRHRQHVVLNQPVHAGNADGRQQAADGCRNQADQQRDQHEHGLRRARIDRERLQGHDGQQEDDGQAGQQNVQRDLVGRLLPLGAFHQGDHAIQEGLAGIRRHLDFDLVGEHARAAGDRGAIAARLANDGRRLAGDGRLVHRSDAFDDLAIRRVRILRPKPGPDRRHAASSWELARSRPPSTMRLAIVSDRAFRSVSACALPRPSAMASAKLANKTVNHKPERDLQIEAKIDSRSRRSKAVVITLPTSTTNMTGLPIM